MKESDVQRIWHIKNYCEEILQTVERFGENYEIFTSDKVYFNAICMNIMQIGELSGSLSDEFKDSTKNRITWGALKGMRNMFAHKYISTDKLIIWNTATKDIPVLLNFCKDIIFQNPDDFKPFDFLEF